MNANKCSVLSCRKSRAENAILHLFPNPSTEEDRFNQWIYAVGGNVLVLDPQQVYKHARVCHLHFQSKYHFGSNRLSKNAIPTLLLKAPRPALKEISNVVKEPTVVDTALLSIDEPVASTSRASRPALKEISNVLKEPTVIDTALPSIDEPVASTSRDTTTMLQESSNLYQSSSASLQAQKDKPKSAGIFDRDTVILRTKLKNLLKHKESLKMKYKKALNLTENPAFQKAMGKFSPAAATFTNLQFREAGKHKLGCRFNKDEKVMALALYKQGPRAYKWLQKFFVLPSPLTLSRMISRASLRPGINENLFKELKKKVLNMKTLDKLCILLFDEVAISPHFDYNMRTDCVSGFVNNGSRTSSKIADHALVFMVRGVHKNYKQPIAYTFCSSSTQSYELASQIKTMIMELQTCGLNVVATICDQGSSNVSAINWLVKRSKEEYLRQGAVLNRNTFIVNDAEIVPLYDPPHLIKGIRNNLLTKNLNYMSQNVAKVAKWEHLTLLYAENPAYKGIRLMPKLTETHIIPNKIPKMKVKCATQVFSKTVAANMGYLSNLGILPAESQDTADLLIFFDDLFDSVNGSYTSYTSKRKGKPLLGPVTPKSLHKNVWREAKTILKSMSFSASRQSVVVPSITNWIKTIENIEYLVDVLAKKYNLTSVWMRHFNQDPLENFFGCIRSHGYRNTSPSCAGFESAFASLLINNLSSLHSPGANCEADDCRNFKSLRGLFFDTPEASSYTLEIDFDDISDNIFVDLEIKRSNPKIRAQLEYVAGYVLKKLKLKCKNCKACLYTENCNEFAIGYREYNKKKTSLTYPAIALLKCFSSLQDIVTNIIKKDSKKKNIRQYIKTIFSVVVDYNFIKCETHKRDVIKNIEDTSTKIFLYNWCKDTNKILSGSRTDYDSEDAVQKMALHYRKKRTK